MLLISSTAGPSTCPPLLSSSLPPTSTIGGESDLFQQPSSLKQTRNLILTPRNNLAKDAMDRARNPFPFADGPAHADPCRSIAGSVTYADQSPGVCLTIKAFDQDLRVRTALGDNVTDTTGHYDISYTGDKFARPEKASADLVLQVVAADGKLLFETPVDSIMYNAPAKAVINITIPVPRAVQKAEFDVIVDMLQPFLKVSNLASPSLLQEDGEHRDVTFLAKESGTDAVKITYIALSYRLGDLHKQVSSLPCIRPWQCRASRD